MWQLGRRGPRPGMTLVEILVAMGILSMLLLFIYTFFFHSLRVGNLTTQKASVVGCLRRLTGILREDLMILVEGADLPFELNTEKQVYSFHILHGEKPARVQYLIRKEKIIREVQEQDGKAPATLSLSFPRLKSLHLEKEDDSRTGKLTLRCDLTLENNEKIRFLFYPLFANKRRLYEKLWKP